MNKNGKKFPFYLLRANVIAPSKPVLLLRNFRNYINYLFDMYCIILALCLVSGLNSQWEIFRDSASDSYGSCTGAVTASAVSHYLAQELGQAC